MHRTDEEGRRLHRVDTTEATAVVERTPATPQQALVDRLQSRMGNRLTIAALSGASLGGMEDLVSAEMFMATSGFPDHLQSNAAVAGAMAAAQGGGPAAVMRRTAGGEALDDASVMALIKRSRGAALPTPLAKRFSAALGHDFRAVQVHTDATAAQAAEALHAQAFTVGRDIFFGAGRFAPEDRQGEALLAHELTHVRQHDEGRIHTGGSGLSVSDPGDTVEREAYAVEANIHDTLADIDALLGATPDTNARADVDGAPISDAPISDAPISDASVALRREEKEQPEETPSDTGAAAASPDANAAEDNNAPETQPESATESGQGEGDAGAADAPSSSSASGSSAAASFEKPSPGDGDLSSPTVGADDSIMDTGETSSLPGLFQHMMSPSVIANLAGNIAAGPTDKKNAKKEITSREAEVTRLLKKARAELSADQHAAKVKLDALKTTQTLHHLSGAVQARTGRVTANVKSAGDTAKGTVDASVDELVKASDKATLSAKALLKAQAMLLQAEIYARRPGFQEKLQSIIEKLAVTLSADLDRLIDPVEILQKEEEKQAATIARSNVLAGSIERARAAAKLTAKANVHKRYVKGMRKVRDRAVEQVRAFKGEPVKMLIAEATAPTLEEIWPATQLLEENLDHIQKKSDKDAKAAKDRFAALVPERIRTHEAASQKTRKGADEATQKNQKTVDRHAENIQIAQRNRSVLLYNSLQEQEKRRLEELRKQLGDADLSDEKLPAVLKEIDGYIQGLEASKTLIVQADQKQALEEDARWEAMLATYRANSAAGEASLAKAQDQDSRALSQEILKLADQITADNNRSAQGVQAAGNTTVQRASDNNKTRLAQFDTTMASFVKQQLQTWAAQYARSAAAQMMRLEPRMEKDVETAAAGAAKKEDADRQKRSKLAREAAETVWGTDETRYMKALAGITPAQGAALQVHYSRQYAESLKTRIDAEVDGSLQKSLEAWLDGDPAEAARQARKYADTWTFLTSNPAEVAEVALRSLSDETREELKNDDYFTSINQENQGLFKRSIVMRNKTSVFVNLRSERLAVLSDMSKSQEEAGRYADAIQLAEEFQTIWDTDENKINQILGARDREGNRQLAAVYKTLTTRSLRTDTADSYTFDKDIVGNRTGSVESLALLEGDKGVARADRLERSMNGSDDIDMAEAALGGDGGIKGGATWFDKVNAQQEQADFYAAVQEDSDERAKRYLDPVQQERDDEANRKRWTSDATRAADEKKAAENHDDRQKRADQERLERQTQNAQASTYAKNKKALKDDYIPKHFAGWWDGDDTEGGDLLFGYRDRNKLAIERLQAAVEGGGPAETETFAHGVDRMGTNEANVKSALQAIAGEPDFYVRLDKLDKLGAYCVKHMARSPNVQKQDGANVKQLPAYFGKLPKEFKERAGFKQNLTALMKTLDAESSGGEQFDFEMLVAKAMIREENVIDRYDYAKKKVLFYVSEDELKTLLKDEDVTRFAGQDKLPDVKNAGMGFGTHGSLTDDPYKKLLAMHYMRLTELVEKKGWYNADGSLVTDEGKGPTTEAKKTFEAFSRHVDAIDTGIDDFVAQDQAFMTYVTTAVGITVGVVVTLVSAGTATAAAAALYSAAITFAGAAGTMVIKLNVMGNRYELGGEAFWIDLGSAVCDAALGIMTPLEGAFSGLLAKIGPLDRLMQKTILGSVVDGMSKALPGAAKGALFDEALWDKGDVHGMAQKIAFQMVQGGAGSWAESTAGVIIKKIGKKGAIWE
ncbi:MAG: DUF4157 domain-containing protein, partial [Myxococcota bacterium]